MIKDFILKLLVIFPFLLSTLNIHDIRRILIGIPDRRFKGFFLEGGLETKVSKSAFLFAEGVRVED